MEQNKQKWRNQTIQEDFPKLSHMNFSNKKAH